MRELDVLVHPEYPAWFIGDDRFGSPKFLDEYLKDIAIVVKKRRPLLVSVGDELLRKKTSPKLVFSSELFDDGPQSEHRGSLNEGEWRRLRRVISKKNPGVIRVHGAFFPQCVTDCVYQLLGLRLEDAYWPGWGRLSESEIEGFAKKIAWYEHKGKIRDAGVRLGTVMIAPSEVGELEEDRSWEMPYGDFDAQISDERTRILPYR